MRNKPWLLLMLVLAILAGLPGCNPAAAPQNVTKTPSPVETALPGTATPTALAPEPVSSPTATPFVDTSGVTVPSDIRSTGLAKLYQPVAAAVPARYDDGNYKLPVAYSALVNGGQFQLSAAQVQLLQQNGFVVTPGEWLEFFQPYEQVRYQELPVFVSTDSVYHVYHLLFDKILRDLEREQFIPTLESLTTSLTEAAQAQYEEARGTSLEDPARRAWGYFVVAQQLMLENPPAIPDAVKAEVEPELAKIMAHSGIQPSSLLTLPEALAAGVTCSPDATPEEAAKFYCEDYSQYVPRGHYTRDERLMRYFRTMMWYGRINLRLKYARETKIALLITRLIRQTSVQGQPAEKLWVAIYDPTVFLVGKSDDLGFHEYGPVMDAVYGENADLTALADEGKLAAFTKVARELPPPQVNSMWVYIWEDEDEVTQGFRFMGQRFVLDAYIFEQLIHRNVTDRWLPSGLDVFAAMGSEEAYAILQENGEMNYPNYDTQMAKVRGEIAGLQQDSWTQNLYWNWLYALRPLAEPKGESYPPFMRTQAWARKDLHTASGSWTELKHDTILYAKQVMAELGGGGEMPAPPRAYVEPNPEVYARLRALAQMTYSGLEQYGYWNGNGNLVGDSYQLESLEEMLTFLQRAAERELRGELLETDEYERLKYYGGWLERITLASADTEGEGRNIFSDEDQSALVADVATDPNGRVLEEATGRVFNIYVVTPDGNGGLQIAQGAVYSYYEFAWPIEDRLTDEKWQAMVTAKSQPPQPEWTKLFIAQ